MSRVAQVILILFLSVHTYAQTDSYYLKMANTAYDAGNNDIAKIWYQKAAEMGNADAHYALAYKYVLTDEQRIAHYSAAARKGHAKATSEIMEALLFRANSLTVANPELAYQIYTEAKKANPLMEIYNEAADLATVRECMEAGQLDTKEFIEKYKITKEDTVEDYGIWELAAEASHNGRFGKPNPKLVLQLVCKGGQVPAEVQYAVADCYWAWKKDSILVFNPCTYVTSGIGLAYCSQKESIAAEKKYQNVIKKLAEQLKNDAGILLPQAYKAADNFFESKAFQEEGNDGSGYVAWSNESADAQKAAYLDLVKKINNGYRPTLSKEKNYDKELNIVYQKVINRLKTEPIKGGFMEITDHDVVMVQRTWLKYRDSTAFLFERIAPELTEDDWKNYLSYIRIKELQKIDKLRN